MNLRLTTPILATMGGIIAPNLACAQEAKSPNIIMILADDLGWGDVGYNGNKVVKTPTIDAMAKSGAELTNFHTVSPLSSPTRASVLTGRHPFRMGIYAAHTEAIKNAEVTIAEVCKSNGYATGFFGKWHLGWIEVEATGGDRGYYSPPQYHGFEEVFATRSAMPTWNPTEYPAGWIRWGVEPEDWSKWGTPSGKEWNSSRYLHNGVVETENLDGDDSRVIMDRVIPFIEESKKSDKPFMACVWFHTPHEPVVAGPEYLAMYKDLKSIEQQHYFGAITAMDDQIARLIEYLKEIGEYENTIITFTSDNGPSSGVKNRKVASSGDFRGSKHKVFQGGVRVPGIMLWPEGIKSGLKVNTQLTTCDYFPTLIDLAKLNFKPYKAYRNDGISMVTAFENVDMTRDQAFFIGWKRIYNGTYGRAVIDGDYKYLYQEKSKTPELYNITKDPNEKTNIIKDNPEIAAKMELQLQEMERSFVHSDQGGDYKSY